jgi:RNA polymerase sigma-70 factor, ECF subfamily
VTTTSPTLLERLRRPSAGEAWERFVDLYTPLLLAWCRRLGVSDADAADLTQGVFLTLYQRLPEFQYDVNRSFRAWLKTVLLNAWRNQVRQRSGERAGRAPPPEEIADTDPRLELDEAEYRAHLVRRALSLMRERFEPSTWRACWEFVVEDRSAEDVARELGLTANAVYLAKARVLRQLRHELQWLLD